MSDGAELPFDELTRAGWVVELGFAEDAATRLGYATRWVDTGQPNSLPELVIEFGDDATGRSRGVHASFIPDGGEMESTKFLLLDSPLPFTVPSESRVEIRQAIAIVNEHVALGRFGLRADGAIYFRYVLAVPKFSSLDNDMLGEVLAFVEFHQENFGDYLEGVVSGAVSVLVLDAVIAQAG